ncbi:hypothetical protein TrVFT333_006485 [Trichoderma virens FT-333]|nr:hypothetical protein TrVFT333_006485 [Trichoderma virens FT-333]
MGRQHSCNFDPLRSHAEPLSDNAGNWSGATKHPVFRTLFRGQSDFVATVLTLATSWARLAKSRMSQELHCVGTVTHLIVMARYVSTLGMPVQ